MEHEMSRKKSKFLFGLGFASFVTAWFLPVINGGITLPNGLPGWEAFWLSISPLWQYSSNDQKLWQAIICVTSGLSNLLAVTGLIAIVRQSAKGARCLGWALLLSFLDNSMWFVLTDRSGWPDFRIGYYLWCISFVGMGLGLLGLKSRKSLTLLENIRNIRRLATPLFHTIAVLTIGLEISGCGGIGHARKDHLVARAVFSPDGRQVAYGGFDVTWSGSPFGYIMLLDAKTGAKQSRLDTGDFFWSMAYSPNGDMLAIGRTENEIRLYDPRRGTLVRSIPVDRTYTASLAFSPDGNTIAGGTERKNVRTWDVATGLLLLNLGGHSDSVINVAYSPDGALVASCGYGEHSVLLSDSKTGSPLRTLADSDEAINWIEFLPTGHSLAARMGRNVVLWDTQTGSVVNRLRGHTDTIDSMSISGDGKTMVTSCDQDKDSIRLWDVASGAQIGSVPPHSGHVQRVAMSPDGTKVFTAGNDPDARMYDIPMHTVLWSFSE
jgi:WD40 repeat protein